jgi:hypothetical protein
MNRSGLAALTLLVPLLLAGCSGGMVSVGGSGGSGGSRGSAGSAGGGISAGDARAGYQACTGGLKGTEPGVVRITCDGTATIRVQAGGAGKDFHGGVCHSVGDVWTASAGVIIDETGTGPKYTGPPVDSVAVNNTSASGKGTIQLTLGGKHYFDLGGATVTLAAAGKSAHLEGTSEKLSDAPGAKIVIDVAC